ncbi:hypothetical protein V8E53_002960 [Lactarius tabidus]
MSLAVALLGSTAPLFSSPHAAQATQIDMIPELIGWILRRIAYRRGSPAHQRHLIRFSAAVPALLDVSASEGINILRNTPSILSTLQEHVRDIRATRDRVEAIAIPPHAASPIIHIHLLSAASSSSATLKPPNPTTPAPREALSFDIADEERVLQDIVDEVLAQGVWITRTCRGKAEYTPCCHVCAVV